MAANTIVLSGSPRGRYEEAFLAATAKPGHACIKDSTGKFKKNDVAGADNLVYVLREVGAFNGTTITDAIPQDSIAMGYIPEPGDKLQMRVPANAAAIAFGGPVKLDATGCLIAQGGTGTIWAFAEEALDNSAVGAEAFIAVRKK